MRPTALCLALMTSTAVLAETGTVKFTPAADEAKTVERHRLDAHEFPFALKEKRDLPVSKFRILDLTFPSPIETPDAENNTVHAEFYLPEGKGPFPAVIILDILDGSQVVSKGIASVLASHGIAGLCVQMPYYGPRRPPGSKKRLLSPDVKRSLEGFRQAVLDNRRAAAWLASRPEIDAKRLGIHGTSLGSFTAALTASAEPRLNKVSLLLGGGGLVDAYWDHPEAKKFLGVLAIWGGDKESLKKAIAPADPLTYADALSKRDLLMIAAKRDDVVPPKAAQALWEATGKQKIVWLNSTHVGAVFYLFDATKHIVEHFK